jgi:type IV pilus assembly protein PilY1
MAKSGIMNSFLSIDAKYRIGFGSIDGGGSGNGNYKQLPSSRYSYSDAYNGGTNYIAKVTPFGDGSSGSDQKSQLWSWVDAAVASGGTPLRQALSAAGKYYTTDQPWQTSSSDTTELACRQSYTILTTDGFWNDDTPSGIGNTDNTKATITGPNNQTYTYTPASPYSDNQSNTLADVAMKYWQTDLMSGATGDSNILNEVPTSAEDPAFWQHMTTFTLGLGFTPTNIIPSSTTIDQVFAWANGGSAISGFSWPAPSGDSINNIADLAHAAVNGHGGFYSATSPDAFTSGLKDALKRASERVGTGASLAANSTELKTGTFAFQANYYTAKWKGDLKAIAVDPNTGALAATPTWTASTVLPAFASRKIYTYNPAVSPASAILFNSPTSLSSAEDTALGTTATAQQNMINYLRGDGSLEQRMTGGTFRNRDTPLGDIVDSQPVYVGQPDANQFSGQTFTGTSSFAAYAGTARTALIYVAANDGMLHAFDATTGAETFAYLPAAVITNGIANLANTDYGVTLAVPHQYFNDGELTIADVYFGSAWHSVAVGTTGRGAAKAIYALDVTNPSSISLLWERSAGDGKTNADYIGQMTGKPIIAQVADGSWAVFMGNGYNSVKGVAALLQFGISDGTLTAHQTDTATNNGLAAPGVWINDQTNGISTIAYAGDVQGREWSFVLNNGTASTPSSSGTKLFTAKDSSNNIQPITAGTLLGKDPATGNLWIFLGTGQYLSTSDLASTATQSWYGLIVQSATSGIALDGSQGRTSLVQRSIIAETAGTAAVLNADGSVKTAAVAPARAITPAPATPDMTGKSGWYIDLLSPTSATDSKGLVTYTPNTTAQGERIVTPNLFQGNQLIATTRIPQATDICNPSGRGWIMSVNPFTGTAPTSSFFDLNGDGQINQPADYILVNGQPVASSGIGFSSLPNNPIFVGGSMLVSFDNGSASSIQTAGSGADVNRVSWRELINQ